MDYMNAAIRLYNWANESTTYEFFLGVCLACEALIAKHYQAHPEDDSGFRDPSEALRVAREAGYAI